MFTPCHDIHDGNAMSFLSAFSSTLCSPCLRSSLPSDFLTFLFLCWLWIINFLKIGVSLLWAPWWLRGKESSCRYRRHVFHLWVGKISRRRKWQPTPVFLPLKSHGQRSLEGYSPWGCKRIGYNLSTKQQQCKLYNIMGKLLKIRATHSSTVAWRIPWTEEPGGLQSMGSQRVGHNWVSNTITQS